MQKIQLRSMVFIFSTFNQRVSNYQTRLYIYGDDTVVRDSLKSTMDIEEKTYTALIGGITVIEFEDFREAKNTGNGQEIMEFISGAYEDHLILAVYCAGAVLSVIPYAAFVRFDVKNLFQNFALLENKTVKENLSLIKKSSRTKVSLKEALNRVGLSKEVNKKVYQLSGGEQQRVALARLMMKKCSVVLADEPTGSLDKKKIDDIYL